MTTGQFIKSSIDEQIARILQEMEDVIPAITAEKEIVEIALAQKTSAKIRLEGSNVIIGFNGGYITVWIDLGNGNSQSMYTTYQNYGIHKDTENWLRSIPYKKLKKIHPKTFAADLRGLARKVLLEE